jgi:hypothetical protein
MKVIPLIMGAAVSIALAGCVSAPLALAPVGPNPAGRVNASAEGQLEVFSKLQSHRDGNEYDPNPAWYQHTDYTIYDMQGDRVRHVFNSVGHYEEAPSVTSLSPGEYVVVARAQGYLRVEVPVVIEAGRATRVHLDAHWQVPAGTPRAEVVQMPNGYQVGWRAEHGGGVGIN